jgi:hypothetical protein
MSQPELIPPQPSERACATCMRPLAWLWSSRYQRWICFAQNPADRDTLHVHRCNHLRDDRDWRTTAPVAPSRVRAGAAMARRILGWTRRPDEHEQPEPSWQAPTRHLTVVRPRDEDR